MLSAICVLFSLHTLHQCARHRKLWYHICYCAVSTIPCLYCRLDIWYPSYHFISMFGITFNEFTKSMVCDLECTFHCSLSKRQYAWSFSFVEYTKRNTILRDSLVDFCLSVCLFESYYRPRLEHAGHIGIDRSMLTGHNALLLRQIARDLLHALLHRHNDIWTAFF